MPKDPTADPRGVVLFVAGDHADHVGALRVAGYRVEVAATAVFCHMPCSPGELVAMVERQLAARRPLGGPPS